MKGKKEGWGELVLKLLKKRFPPSLSGDRKQAE